MTISLEEIMAYVDGEMDAEGRSRITQAALADTALAEQIAAQRALRDRLKDHFAPVLAAPVPEEWLEAIRQATARHQIEASDVAEATDAGEVREAAKVSDLVEARQAKAAVVAPIRPRWWNNPWAGAAMAASLVLGVFVGANRQDFGGQGADELIPITLHNGVLVASGNLAKALDSQLASAQDGASIRMVGTFRRAGGDVCRAFAGSQVSGVACHAKGAWLLQHVLPGSMPSPAAYQQAGSDNASVMELAQSMAAGAPFDAAQEREAMGRGWH